MIRGFKSYRRAPGPGTLSFLLNLGKFRKDPLAGFFQSALEYGDVVRYRGLWVSHQLSHPSHIQHVLQSNFSNYRRGRDYQILKSSLGEGLLTSDGALWQRQRKMTQPAFHSQKIASFTRVMAGHTERIMEKWKRFAASGEAFDIVPELMRLTLNIASEALFSTNLESQTQAIREALAVGRDYAVDRAWSFVRPPLSVPTRRNREYLRALGHFHQIIDGIISARRVSGDGVADLLTMLMDARDEDGNAMSDRQLRDEVATLLTAGHETTTLALSWVCYLLARHPEAEEALRAELAFLNGHAPSYDDLFRLKFTRMVIDETMRLYPPVWVLSRTAANEDEIGGYHIPAGSEMLIFPYITHRHPGWWQDPEKFCPERFAPENSASRMKFGYLPFGAGPRTCIGLNFAMTEIQVAVALLFQRFRIRLVRNHPAVRAEPSVTLRPSPGVYIELIRN